MSKPMSVDEIKDKIRKILRDANFRVIDFTTVLLYVKMYTGDQVNNVPVCLMEVKTDEIIIYANIGLASVTPVFTSHSTPVTMMVGILKQNMMTGNLPKLAFTITEKPAKREVLPSHPHQDEDLIYP